MFFQQRLFRQAKDVQDPQGYQDAFASDPVRGAAAICDGASSTLFAGPWAEQLAQAIVQNPPPTDSTEGVQQWLKPLRDAWSAAVDPNSLAWHQKAKFLEGAASTVLWVQMWADPSDAEFNGPFYLRGYAVGDCCLLHVRQGQVLCSFPLNQSEQFNTDPQVLRSIFKRAETIAFHNMEAQCEGGDYLILCTDAVAVWTLQQYEAGTPPEWDEFWNMSESQWEQWLLDLRKNQQIRYDDSTMAVLKVCGSSEEEGEENFKDKAIETVSGLWNTFKKKTRQGLKAAADSKWLKPEEEKEQ